MKRIMTFITFMFFFLFFGYISLYGIMNEIAWMNQFGIYGAIALLFILVIFIAFS